MKKLWNAQDHQQIIYKFLYLRYHYVQPNVSFICLSYIYIYFLDSDNRKLKMVSPYEAYNFRYVNSYISYFFDVIYFELIKYNTVEWNPKKQQYSYINIKNRLLDINAKDFRNIKK